MTSKTVVSSVTEVAGLPASIETLTAKLDALQKRFPGAVIERYLAHLPQVSERVYLAPNAALIGDVRLPEDVSIWYGVVLRADINSIEARERSNIQDGSVVHVGDNDGTFIGEEVVVGHRAVLHGCHVGGGCLIGIQATILDGAKIGEGSVVGAGTLITAGTIVPPRSLVLGTPGRVIKSLSADDEAFHRKLALKYTRLAHNYRMG